jgi:hypothetical protein
MTSSHFLLFIAVVMIVVDVDECAPLLKLTILDKSDQELQVLHPFTLE